MKERKSNRWEFPKYYVAKDGRKFEYDKYLNHGYGGKKHGYEDLPKDGYPYTIEFEKIPKPSWWK